MIKKDMVREKAVKCRIWWMNLEENGECKHKMQQADSRWV